MRATKIKDIEETNDMVVLQTLYKLDPPLQGHEYVIVSAANVIFSGPETYIFAADETGKITSYAELEGSYKGGLDHAEALSGAGY